MKTGSGKSFFKILIFVTLISPLLILLGSGVTPHETFSPGTLEILGFTFLQAGLSAALALSLGLLGAYGLEAAHVKWGVANGRFLEALSLLPNVAPVLLFLLAVMKFAPGLTGLTGIVVIHALLNTGLVAASVLRLFRSKISALADLAWVEGCSRTRFFTRAVIPLLAGDLGLIFSFVFAICFTSLAIPLVIGGSRATTLEVLIWQSIRIEGDFSKALGIAILQLGSILAFTFLLRRRTTTSQAAKSPSSHSLLSQFAGLPVVLLPPALLIISLFDRPWSGAVRLFDNDSLAGELLKAIFGSFVITIGTGFLVSFFMIALATTEPRGFFRKFLLGYVAPSSVITGFAMLIVSNKTGTATYLKICVAITLISVPALYRLYWDAAVSGLRSQRATARTLGASNWLTFRRVVFPQLARPLGFVAGLSSLWAWGDFALSRTIAERDMTLGMMIQSLMSSYRFDLATFLVWILIIGGAATFFFFHFFFQEVGRVLGQKSSR